ncbi:hypothetical protein EG359_17320 [Chryseobacterium joostei]|uniref:Phage uncharacterized protein TIGR01671 n=1 Tax=Chryseobacterium joostei TaxID=112234 RepID=A0A1N7IB01_9FLAO|nr:YopX family protein [Chryseobacterium joostei]AZB01264.1 hypothetical protein EG359_17320 [Chryseobacterium joostei]SIS34248.1 phage uncharacterized protein TIGR01671 [Chryseobacterium joostei]
MNREIKFRGHRIDDEGIVYGHLVIDPKGNYRIYFKPFSDATSNTFFLVKPETVGQYTGLNDKNGVEIYEGDILDEDGFLFQVIYDVQNAKFKLKHIGPYQYPEWNRGIRMNIIGNIHENPELLNPKS